MRICRRPGCPSDKFGRRFARPVCARCPLTYCSARKDVEHRIAPQLERGGRSPASGSYVIDDRTPARRAASGRRLRQENSWSMSTRFRYFAPISKPSLLPRCRGEVGHPDGRCCGNACPAATEGVGQHAARVHHAIPAVIAGYRAATKSLQCTTRTIAARDFFRRRARAYFTCTPLFFDIHRLAPSSCHRSFAEEVSSVVFSPAEMQSAGIDDETQHPSRATNTTLRWRDYGARLIRPP